MSRRKTGAGKGAAGRRPPNAPSAGPVAMAGLAKVEPEAAATVPDPAPLSTDASTSRTGDMAAGAGTSDIEPEVAATLPEPQPPSADAPPSGAVDMAAPPAPVAILAQGDRVQPSDLPPSGAGLPASGLLGLQLSMLDLCRQGMEASFSFWGAFVGEARTGDARRPRPTGTLDDAA